MPTVAWQRRALPWPEIAFVIKMGSMIIAMSPLAFLGGLLMPASSYIGRSGIVDKKGNIVAVTNRPGVCGVGPGPRGCKSTRDDRSPTFGPSVSTGTDPHRPGRPALSPRVSGEGSSLRECKSTRGDRSPTFGSHVPVGTDPHRLGVCFHAGHSISDGTVRKPLSVAFGGCCSATACPDLHRVVISIVYLYVCLLCDGLVLLLNWPVHKQHRLLHFMSITQLNGADGHFCVYYYTMKW